MKLILVRHGETEGNAKKIGLGWSHSPLTEKGIQDANTLASVLVKKKIDMIYCSDLQRCKDTLVPLLQSADIPVEYVKELREQCRGIYELTEKANRNELAKMAAEKGMNYLDFKPEEGESPKEVFARLDKFFNKIVNKYKATDKTILFVTHGGCMVYFNMLFSGKVNELETSYGYPPKNCSITEIEISKDGKIKPLKIDSTEHLKK